MCKHCNHTIHARQHHFGWDNSFAPALTAAPGETILFQCLDSSGGQLGPRSTVRDVGALDFGKASQWVKEALTAAGATTDGITLPTGYAEIDPLLEAHRATR